MPPVGLDPGPTGALVWEGGEFPVGDGPSPRPSAFEALKFVLK